MEFDTFCKDLASINKPWILIETIDHRFILRTYSPHLCPIQVLAISRGFSHTDHRIAGPNLNLSQTLTETLSCGADTIPGYNFI